MHFNQFAELVGLASLSLANAFGVWPEKTHDTYGDTLSFLETLAPWFAAPPVAHARPSFPGSLVIVSAALAGAEEDVLFPPTLPPLDAQSCALNSPVPDTAQRAAPRLPAPSAAPPRRSLSPS